jgi:hypothetical protein
MEKLKSEVGLFTMFYNRIKIDCNPLEQAEQIKDFLEIGTQLLKCINEILDRQKTHLYILEDFNKHWKD